MGGSEACIAVAYQKKGDGDAKIDDRSLEIEVRQTLNSSKGRIRVIGEEYCDDLETHLSNWIRIQSREDQQCQ